MSHINHLTGRVVAVAGAVFTVVAVGVVLLLSASSGSVSAAPTHAAHSAASPGWSAADSTQPASQSAASSGWSAPAAAQPASRSAAAHGATVIAARRTSIGAILTASNGETLYAFTRDTAKREACAATSGCLSVWPMVTTHGSPVAGHGVSHSLLGTITVHGARQVTYAGHPLYGYISDSQPGNTEYVGVSQFGGSWPAVAPSGHLVH